MLLLHRNPIASVTDKDTKKEKPFLEFQVCFMWVRGCFDE